jgi:hypothetical protein
MPDRAADRKAAARTGSIGWQELFRANMLCATELADGRNEGNLVAVRNRREDAES